MKNNHSKFRFIDLFSGIRGFHIAMHENGGECVFASEIDKFARQTYEHNFKNISHQIFINENFNEDITYQDLDYNNIPDFDILCSGFPCQPFSHVGLINGFEDTRGTLFFIRHLSKIKPINTFKWTTRKNSKSGCKKVQRKLLIKQVHI